MIDLLIFIPIALILCGTGQKLLGLVVPGQRFSFLERTIIGFGLGAGSLALTVLAIGLSGFLYRGVLIALLFLLLVIFRRSIVATAKDLVRWVGRIIKIDFSPFERFLLFMMGFVCFFTLIGSLSPMLGMDSAAYHMQDPKLFVKAHKIFAIPYTRESLWPFMMQMFFTFSLCLKGVILGKLFHLSFYAFSVLAIYSLCRRHWARPNAMLAAAIFASIPAIFTVTTYAYTDLAVVFYTVLAFYGFFAWIDTDNNRWFYLSGVMCGFLLGTKLTSATVPVLISVLGLVHVLTRPISLKKKMSPVVFFWLSVFLVCGVWYVRSWIVLGNPIYPFAARFFGGHGYPSGDLRLGIAVTAGIGLGWKQFFACLWPLTLFPTPFGGESIGAAFLIFLPMLVFMRKFSRFFRYVLTIALYLYAAWFFVYQYTRFLFPALIFLSILVAFAYEELSAKDVWCRRFAKSLLVLIFCYSGVLAVYHNVDKIPVVFGFEKEEDYLLDHERSYGIAQYVNRHLPKDAKILNLNEPRLYYFNRDTANANLVQLELLARGSHPTKPFLENYLKVRGFGDYMLVMWDYSMNRPQESSAMPDIFFAAYNKTLLKQTEFAYRDERYVYELWKINDSNIPRSEQR